MRASESERVVHPIPPVYDAHSRILILGSFPSVASREAAFFYGHPRNRFWRVLSLVFEQALPLTVADKRRFLLSHGIALWDVLASCRVRGSADSSITDARPNDLSPLLSAAPIRAVFTNGQTAARCYRRYLLPSLQLPHIPLPSTSPANAAQSLSDLFESWRILRDFC